MRGAIAAISALALAGCVAPSIPEVEPAAGVPLAEDYLAQTRPPSGLRPARPAHPGSAAP